MSTALQTLKQQAESVILSIDSPESAASAISTIDAIAAMTRELRKLLDAALLEHIQASGPIEIQTAAGPVRYIAATEKKIKCRDTKELMQWLYGGCLYKSKGETGAAADMLIQQLGELLAAQPWKHGACRGVLGDGFGQYFSTEVGDKLKVQRLDTRYMKGAHHGDNATCQSGGND